MNVISNILYWISTGLLVPVIVLLIYFFFRALLLIGEFFGQYLSQRKITGILDSGVGDLQPSGVGGFVASLPERSGVPVVTFLKKIAASAGNEARVEMYLTEYELLADKNVASSKMLTKMGPILGLMGTLIPMGPALVGLATGDIASMAYNMQVAFATTVVGLVVSAIGFVTQQVRERWALHDMMILEFVADTIKDNKQ